MKSQEFERVRLAFDRFTENSLKEEEKDSKQGDINQVFNPGLYQYRNG